MSEPTKIIITDLDGDDLTASGPTHYEPEAVAVVNNYPLCRVGAVQLLDYLAAKIDEYDAKHKPFGRGDILVGRHSGAKATVIRDQTDEGYISIVYLDDGVLVESTPAADFDRAPAAE